MTDKIDTNSQKSLVNPLGYEGKKRLSETATYKQTARKNAIDDVSVCVECGKLMRIIECNGINCYVCLEHRVALPVQDN